MLLECLMKEASKRKLLAFANSRNEEKAWFGASACAVCISTDALEIGLDFVGNVDSVLSGALPM